MSARMHAAVTVVSSDSQAVAAAESAVKGRFQDPTPGFRISRARPGNLLLLRSLGNSWDQRLLGNTDFSKL